MADLTAIELKPFIPAKDFERSKQFYSAIGFTMAWAEPELAYFHVSNTAFLLQNFYVAALADNLMIHLLVEDVDAWRAHMAEQDIAGRFGTEISPVEARPWKLRDFYFADPSGVLWRIGQNI